MSKSKLNQIAPADLVADFGIDGFRYCMLRDNPFGPDSEFSHEGLTTRYNTDLANNLGNLLSRVATVVGSKCGGVGPKPSPDSPLASVAADTLVAATEGWLNLQPSIALEATWRLIRDTNAHLEANEPWKAEPGPAVDAVLGDALEVLRLVALLATPAMPATTGQIWSRIGLPGAPTDHTLPAAAAWGGYPGGLPVTRGAPLFPRIRD
jgi:methionyl-tRNA synthetase